MLRRSFLAKLLAAPLAFLGLGAAAKASSQVGARNATAEQFDALIASWRKQRGRWWWVSRNTLGHVASYWELDPARISDLKTSREHPFGFYEYPHLEIKPARIPVGDVLIVRPGDTLWVGEHVVVVPLGDPGRRGSFIIRGTDEVRIKGVVGSPLTGRQVTETLS